MKRLPHGSIKAICEKTRLPQSYLSDLISTRKRPGRKRAKILETAAKEIGKDIPAALWVFGTKEQLRAAVSGNA
ncbi:MAG: hypothetical protein AB7S75_25010 [Desulfococcaceae bacterium]